MSVNLEVALWLIATSFVVLIFVLVARHFRVLEAAGSIGMVIAASFGAVECLVDLFWHGHPVLPFGAGFVIALGAVALWFGVVKYRHDARVQGMGMVGLIALMAALNFK